MQYNCILFCSVVVVYTVHTLCGLCRVGYKLEQGKYSLPCSYSVSGRVVPVGTPATLLELQEIYSVASNTLYMSSISVWVVICMDVVVLH